MLSSITLEYRLGLFNERGFRTINPKSFSERSPYFESEDPSQTVLRVPARDSFLDFFWGQGGPTPSPDPSNPTDGQVYFEVTNTTARQTGNLAELVSPATGELQLIELNVAIGSVPGAFMAKCNVDPEPEPPQTSYIAAVPVFPNSSTFDFEPRAIFGTEDIGGTILDRFYIEYGAISEDSNRYFASAGIINKDTGIALAKNPVTDRWLEALTASTGTFEPEENIEGLRGFQIGYQGDISGNVIRTSQSIEPLPRGNYRVLIIFIEISSLDPDWYIDLDIGAITDLTLETGTTYYDLEVLSRSDYRFTLIEPPFQPRPNRSRATAPVIDEISLPLSTSTKGKREVTLTGSNLSRIVSAKVGKKSADLISKGYDQITLKLPKQSAGMHNLKLVYPSGVLKHSKALKYVKSKLVKSQNVNSELGLRAARQTLRKTLLSNPKIVQVNCVVSVAGQNSLVGFRKQARSLCDEALKVAPGLKVKVVVNKNPIGARSGIYLDYWN